MQRDFPQARPVGLSAAEVGRFSLLRLIGSTLTPNSKEADFEREACSAARALYRGGAGDLTLPLEVLRAPIGRGQAMTPDTAGGYLGGPGAQDPGMIELLQASAKAVELAGTRIGPLVGTYDFPKQLSSPAAYVLGEDEAATASSMDFGLIPFDKKTIGVRIYLTRSFFKDTNGEPLVRRAIATAAGQKMDLLALTGTGGRHQPIGILNWPNITGPEGGENGAAPTRSLILELERVLVDNNALRGKLAHLANGKTMAKLKNTPKHETAANGWVWEDGAGPDPTVGKMNGYPAHVSNQLPSNLVKGTADNCSPIILANWDDFAVASWGSIDIHVDPYTNSDKGGVWITAFLDFDCAVLRAQSFAIMRDALTS